MEYTEEEKNKMTESKSMKAALKVTKWMAGKMGTVQFKPLFNRPKRFHLTRDLPTQAKFVARAFYFG